MVDYGFNQVEISGGDGWINEADMRKVLTGIKDIGGSRVRVAACWQFLEPARGQPTWANMDRALNMCSEFGIQPLLVLQFPNPYWGNGAADFGNFCKMVAARYGSAGTNQVAAYEIMNEQNNIVNLSPPTPAGYAPYLRAAYTAIKSVHPIGSTVITGGVMACVSAFFTTDEYLFVKGLYDAGCQNYFDAIGWHWYSVDAGFVNEPPSATQLFYLELLKCRDLMVAKGDSAKKIWITECGIPFPDASVTLTQARDRLKVMLELLLGNAWIDKVFIYNYRNSGTNLTDVNNVFGAVDFNFVKKQPIWDYLKTLRGGLSGALTSTGTLAGTVNQVRKPSLSGGGTLSATVKPRLYATAALSGGGDLNGDIQGRPNGDLVGDGALTAIARAVYPRAAALSGSGSLTGFVDPRLIRSAVLAGEGSLAATVAQQALYSYVFTGATKPTSLFTDFGLGYYVASNTALSNLATTDGYYYSGGVYKLEQISADHFSEVITAFQTSNNASAERSVMAICRADATATNFVGVLCHWGGANSAQIITNIGGVITIRATGTAALLTDLTPLRISADGNTYTATKNGEVIATWVDTAGDYPFPNNKHTGFGFQHAFAFGNNYGTAGITNLWRGWDLRPTLTAPVMVGPLSGAGVLSAAVASKIPGALAGSGDLFADIFAKHTAVPALAGSGVLSATVVPALVGALSGGGVLTALADPPGTPRTAALVGDGALSGSVFARYSGASALAGSGALSAAVAQAFAPQLAGAGALSAAVNAAYPRSSALAGSGALSAVVSPGKQNITYTFSGTTKPAGMVDVGQCSASAVSGGVLKEGTANNTVNGQYNAVALYPTPVSTSLYSASATIASGAQYYAALGVAVGFDSAGTNGVMLMMNADSGFANQVQIMTKVGSTYTLVYTANNAALNGGGTDVLTATITFNGTNYVYTLYKNGVAVPSATWTDTANVIGTPGKYWGAAFQSLWNAGAQYKTYGLTALAAADT